LLSTLCTTSAESNWRSLVQSTNVLIALATNSRLLALSSSAGRVCRHAPEQRC
jgi:hypothetical protein